MFYYVDNYIFKSEEDVKNYYNNNVFDEYLERENFKDYLNCHYPASIIFFMSEEERTAIYSTFRQECFEEWFNNYCDECKFWSEEE